MAECKKCGKKFHACGSCCIDYGWAYDYCCQNCWESSEEYAEHVNKINQILDNLPRELWGSLEDLMGDDGIYRIFDSIHKERTKE